MLELTKREKHILIILGIFLALIILFPGLRGENTPDLELLLLLIIVAPLAAYFVTDPEKRKQ